MGVRVGPTMSPEELERVLKYLPEPTYAEVALFGRFDYSSIYRQAREVVQGVRLKDGRGLVFILEGASKEEILNIYRKSHELKDVRPTRGAGIPKRIDLHNVGWLDDRIQVELTPCEVNVEYRGQEPDYISQMRQELIGTKVRLRIKVKELK